MQVWFLCCLRVCWLACDSQQLLAHSGCWAVWRKVLKYRDILNPGVQPVWPPREGTHAPLLCPRGVSSVSTRLSQRDEQREHSLAGVPGRCGLSVFLSSSSGLSGGPSFPTPSRRGHPRHSLPPSAPFQRHSGRNSMNFFFFR